jgi:hypothetical protein
MRPSGHIIASFTAGAALWFFTKSIYAGLLCFASGVLVDIDHIAEYIIHHGWRGVTIKNMYRACENTGKHEGHLKFGRLYVVLHAVEIALLLWAITVYTGNIYLLAVTLGYSLHLILDYIGNSIYPFSYFILWRAIKGFRTDKVLRKD